MANHTEVYCLIAPNRKRYVGVTVNFPCRIKAHRLADSTIGRALRKYGLGSFRIEVLFSGSSSAAYRTEVQTIKSLGTLIPKGYNVARGGAGGSKTRHSAASRKKMSLARRRAWSRRTPEEKARILAPSLRAMAEHNKGRSRPKEVVERMRLALKGIPKSLEHRKKLSESARGRSMAYLHTEEVQRKRSDALRGRRPSEETKRKISEAIKRYWALKKEAV